jgi:hypothetical protein
MMFSGQGVGKTASGPRNYPNHVAKKLKSKATQVKYKHKKRMAVFTTKEK